MAESSSRTLTCSVLFVELAGYAHLPAGEQMRQKRMLNALLAQELTQVPKPERVVHDYEGAAAVAFLSDVEAGLVAAIGVQGGAGELKLRMGLNFGTVHVVKDLGGQTTIVGDGVNDAQRGNEGVLYQVLRKAGVAHAPQRKGVKVVAMLVEVRRGDGHGFSLQ